MDNDTKKLRSAIRLFYHDPGYNLFINICNNMDILRDYGEYFTVWKNACLSEYGDIWGVDIGPDIYDSLRVKANNQPTLRIFMMSLFAFYASGNRMYIDLCYTSIILGEFSRLQKQNLLNMVEKI